MHPTVARAITAVRHRSRSDRVHRARSPSAGRASVRLDGQSSRPTVSTLRIQARHHEPSLRPPRVDQLLGAEARTRPQVSQVSLRGARPDAYASRCVGDRPASGDERGEDINLTGGACPRAFAAQASVPHARSPAAANHSSRPSIRISSASAKPWAYSSSSRGFDSSPSLDATQCHMTCALTAASPSVAKEAARAPIAAANPGIQRRPEPGRASVPERDGTEAVWHLVDEPQAGIVRAWSLGGGAGWRRREEPCRDSSDRRYR